MFFESNTWNLYVMQTCGAYKAFIILLDCLEGSISNRRRDFCKHCRVGSSGVYFAE